MGERTPVFKKGDKQAKEFIARLQYSQYLEKCLSIYCVNKSLRTTIVSSIQDNKREKHSCESTLISLVEEWRKALDSKEKVYLLAMDMSNKLLTPFTTL